MRLVSLGLVLFFAASAFAEDTALKTCTSAEAVKVERQAASLKGRDQVYRSYKQFSQCDDGAIAEGYSDSITRLLADEWKSFSRLHVLTNRSTGFRDFVLKHIDETVPEHRLAKIASNARSACATADRNLCLSIAKATGK